MCQILSSRRDDTAHSNTRSQILFEFCGGPTGPILFFWPCRGLSRAQVVTPLVLLAVERKATKCFQRLSCHLNGGFPVTDCCLNVPVLRKLIRASGAPWLPADSRKVAASSDWILLVLCAPTCAVTSERVVFQRVHFFVASRNKQGAFLLCGAFLSH